MKTFSLQDIISNGEMVDLECKAAQGRDGTGEVPASFWETYSAMANTNGGEIYLGIEEISSESYRSLGIKDTNKVKKALWDTLHGKNKVNRNILNDDNVEVVLVDGNPVIKIHVPRARRQERPVHLGTNPFGNTYLRRHEGDYKADDETVRRMLAESVEDSRDDKVLSDFGIEDLDKETISAYRNRFSAVKPGHPWLELPAEEFLDKVGAAGKDRATGKTGIRLAGLLMFGRSETIREIFPNYMVDYQEQPEPKTEQRWIDRVVPDGTWSGNLYDFFQKVYWKLTTNLKIPFQLKDGVRSDDTPIHEALREALTNTLIHADYTGRVSILVVKRPDMFRFRNPGHMRVSLEQAIHGGASDCRNRRMQNMFMYVGLGDHAGSGIPKIFRNWEKQSWRLPLLRENTETEETVLELRMISLLSEDSVRMLDGLFGDRFRALPELERIILITAATEDRVNHDRIKEIAFDHPKDISSALSHLVHENMLIKQGETRGSYYQLPTQRAAELLLPLHDSLTTSSPDLPVSSPDLPVSSPDLPVSSPDLKLKLGQILSGLGLSAMPGKINAETMRSIILQLCEKQSIMLKELSIVLERDPKSLRDQYLTPMTAEGLLELKYPNNRNHPEQAYRSKQ